MESRGGVPAGGSTSTTPSSSGGESVKREVKTETIGQGPSAVTRTTTIETRTTSDGRTHTNTTVRETRAATDTFAEVGRSIIIIALPTLSRLLSPGLEKSF